MDSMLRSIGGTRLAFKSPSQRGHARQCPSCQRVVASSQADAAQASAPDLGRRPALLSMAAAALGVMTASGAAPPAAFAKDTAQVGTYLPKSDIDGFSTFVPDRSKTPVSASVMHA